MTPEERIFALYEEAKPVDVLVESPNADDLLTRDDELLDWRRFSVSVWDLFLAVGASDQIALEERTDPEDFEERYERVQSWLDDGGFLDDAPLLLLLGDEDYPVDLWDGLHRLAVARDRGYGDVPVIAAWVE